MMRRGDAEEKVREIDDVPMRLIINFGCRSLKDEILRVVNNHIYSANSANSA